MKYHNVLCFLKILFLTMNEVNTSELTYMAASIANSVYKLHFVTSVVWWDTHMDTVNEFLKAFNGSYITVPIRKGNGRKLREINQAVGFNQTVFFATSPEQFWYWARSLYEDIVIPIRVLLVIINPSTSKTELTKYTGTAWKNDIADIVIVSANDADENNITLTTYFPYGKGICGDYTPVTLESNINIENIFPKKFNNFHRCPVRVTVLQYLPYLHLNYVNGTIMDITALDGKFSRATFESLNATMDIVSVVEHSGLESNTNGTVTGAFGELIKRRADIFLPTDIMNYWRYSRTQISPVLRTYDINWNGPRRREIYAWAKIILPFFTNITPFLCLSFVIFVIVTILVQKVDLRKPKLKDSVLFQSFTIFLGQDTKFITNSILVNSLFVLWIWFCLVVRIAYQGDLVEALHKVILEPPLGSLEEAVTKVDGYGGMELYKEYYSDSPLEKNYQVLQLVEMMDYVLDINNGKRFLLAVNAIVKQLYFVELQVLRQPINRASVCWFMRPGWAASKAVATRIQRMLEYGFLQKILLDYRYGWKITYKVITPREEFVEVKPLGMSVFGALFFGLGVLWVICIIVFIAEIVYFKYKNKPVIIIEE